MRNANDRADDILLAAEDAATIVGRGRRRFNDDRILQRAAKNLVAEIGEAAKALPNEITDQMPRVPWSAIRGMREKVVHDYPEMDLDVLWETLAHGVPVLADEIRKVLR